MKRLLFGLAVFLWVASPVAARECPEGARKVGEACVATASLAGPTPAMLAQLAPQLTPPSPAQPSPGVVIDPPAVPAAPAIIDTGTWAGQALTWMVTVGGGAIATMLTGLIYKLLQKAGIQASDALRARLQEIILNGLNAGAKAAAEQLQGRGQVVIKDQAVATTVRYVQAHGADTIRALGLDPMSPAAVEAIKARIETAIADPAVPTPKVLDSPPEAAATPANAPPAAKVPA